MLSSINHSSKLGNKPIYICGEWFEHKAICAHLEKGFFFVVGRESTYYGINPSCSQRMARLRPEHLRLDAGHELVEESPEE